MLWITKKSFDYNLNISAIAQNVQCIYIIPFLFHSVKKFFNLQRKAPPVIINHRWNSSHPLVFSLFN